MSEWSAEEVVRQAGVFCGCDGWPEHAVDCTLRNVIEAIETAHAAGRRDERAEQHTCIVCKCELIPNESPPHCESCFQTEEHDAEWEDRTLDDKGPSE